MVTILKPHRRQPGDARIETAGAVPDEADKTRVPVKSGITLADEADETDAETGTGSMPGEGPNPTA